MGKTLLKLKLKPHRGNGNGESRERYNMKYHKIKGVDKSICTAEQKIAYNLSFAYREYVIRAGYDVPTAAHKIVELYKNGYGHKPGEYDIDAIFSALLAGLKNYCQHPFIATDFETIGKAFPALYL